jgi:hypothetical protein
MVMRYAHHYPESLRAGIEILDHVSRGNQHSFSTISYLCIQEGEESGD